MDEAYTPIDFKDSRVQLAMYIDLRERYQSIEEAGVASFGEVLEDIRYDPFWALLNDDYRRMAETGFHVPDGSLDSRVKDEICQKIFKALQKNAAPAEKQ